MQELWHTMWPRTFQQGTTGSISLHDSLYRPNNKGVQSERLSLLRSLDSVLTTSFYRSKTWKKCWAFLQEESSLLAAEGFSTRDGPTNGIPLTLHFSDV